MNLLSKLCPKWLARWILLRPRAQEILKAKGLEFQKGWDRPKFVGWRIDL